MDVIERCPYCDTPLDDVKCPNHGVIPGAYAARRKAAEDEARALRQQLAGAVRALEDMTAERDDYKDRWETLGRVARRRIERLEAQLRGGQ